MCNGEEDVLKKPVRGEGWKGEENIMGKETIPNKRTTRADGETWCSKAGREREKRQEQGEEGKGGKRRRGKQKVETRDLSSRQVNGDGR